MKRESVEIIAEIAQGYQGDPSLARLLARAAADTGANAVKFQLVYADELATPDHHYYSEFGSLAMPQEAWQIVADDLRANGTELYFDVFGENSLLQAYELGAAGVKIHAADFHNTLLVSKALELMPCVLVSIGGIHVEEIEEFCELHQVPSDSNLCFMYGFQAEPTPVDSNNLLRLRELKNRFAGCQFGFMDHTDGRSDDAMVLALMALPLGISCVEKHISLDHMLQLEDCVSALSPSQFQTFVQMVRRLEEALGTDSLDLTTAELEYRKTSLKSVVATRELNEGEKVVADDVCLKRTPLSSPPSSVFRVEQVIGRILAVDVRVNQKITENMF